MTFQEFVQVFGPVLLQTTVVLAVAAVMVLPVLRTCRRPWVHQLVWGGVLLLGLAGMRIPVALPVVVPAAEPPVEPVAVSAEIVAGPENPVPDIFVATKEILPAMTDEPAAFEPLPVAIAFEPAPVEPAITEPETSNESETAVSGLPRKERLLATHPEADASGSFALIFFVLWGGVVFVQLLRHFVRYFLLLRMLRHAEPGDESTLALWTEILDRAGAGKRRPKLAMMPDVGPAMVRTPSGYTLALSKSHWNELDTELRRGVMRHELAHFLHGDFWKTLFARLVVLLHWFNPLAHLAARRFEEAIEWSADSFSYGAEEKGLEQFAAAMLSLHETTPQNYRYRIAFGTKDILRRLEFLKRLKSGVKESPWKTGLVLALSLILFVLGAVNIRIVAQEKKPDGNLAAQDITVRPLSERVADLVEQIEKENLKGEKLREKIGADANDEFLQSVAEEMLRLKRSYAAVEVVNLMRDTGKKDNALLSIARRQLFAAFRKPQADTSMFHKALDTASLIFDKTVRDNMRSLVLLHYTKCVGFERMNQPKRFERDKKLAMLLAMHVIEGPENTPDRAEGIWNVPGRQGSYVVNQYSEQTPEPTLPGFTFKEKSELIDKIVGELKEPFDRGLVHESFAYALKIRIYPDWKDEYKKTAEEDARWRLTEAKVEYRKSDKPEAKKRLENIDELFDKLELVRTEIEPGKSLVGVQNYSPEHRPIHLATGNPNAATATPDTIPDRMVLPNFPGSIYDNGPHRDKLNDRQIVYVTWDEATFKQYYATTFCRADKTKEEAETEWISVLKEQEPLHRRGETKFYRAINGLAMLQSKAAIPELTRIATERIHKDNSYRHNSVKALGWIGDPKVVPDLIPMLYFVNFNCRLEAQVSLVRLTGVNFGYDWQAWGNWWNENRRKFGAGMPEFDMKFVDWIHVGYIWYVDNELKKHFDPEIDPRLLAYADPEVQKIQDRTFLLEKETQLNFQEKQRALNDELEKAIRKKLDGKVRKIDEIPEAEFPKIVSTSPAMGAVDVDPSLTELSVTFDRPMAEGMAWYTRDGGATFPTRTKPLEESYKWSGDRKTNTIFNLVLEPGKTYNIWLNTEEELLSLVPDDGFRSHENMPLRPVHFTFSTAKNEARKTELTDAEKEKKAREYYALARGVLAHEIVVLERAITDLDNAIRLKPDFVDAYLERARKREILCVQYLLDKRFDGKDYDERKKKEIEALRPALADCNEAIRLAPDNAKAYSVRAGIHIAMGDSEAKFDDETKAIELDPLPKYYASRASTFAVVQYDTAAYADFMEAEKRTEDRADRQGFHDKTWNEVIERFGGEEKAEKVYRDFRERKVDYVTAYRHLLRAETLYRQALPVPRPKDFKNRDQKEFRKLLEQALAECNAAIEIDPNFDGFWTQRGRIHGELGNIDDALRDHTEGIRLRPDRGDYWARANLYGKKGDLQRQLDDLDKEIDIRKPDDPWLDSIKSSREKVLKKLGDTKAKPADPGTRPIKPEAMPMRLTVLDADGKPIAGATGHASRVDRDSKRPGANFKTDENGVAQIERTVPDNASWACFNIKTAGYMPYFAVWEANREPKYPPAEFTVKLDKAKTIGGTVLDPDGKPVNGVKVEFSFPYGTHTFNDESTHCAASGRTDVEGRWTCGYVPMDVLGTMRFYLHHPDFQSTQIETDLDDVKADGEGKYSHVFTIQRGNEINGTVKDESGKPIDGARVEIQFFGIGGSEKDMYRRTATDAEGRYRFATCPLTDSAAVVAQAPGFAGRYVETPIGSEPKTVDIVLGPSKPLKLRFTDEKGKPVENPQVSVSRWGLLDGTSIAPPIQKMLKAENYEPLKLDDGNGNWVWSDALAGPFQVAVRAEGFMMQENVDAQADGEVRTVVMKPWLEAAGTVLDDETGKPIPAFRIAEGYGNVAEGHVSWQSHGKREGKDGSFRYVDDLPQRFGRRLRIEADGYENCDSRLIENNEGSIELTFRMKKADAKTSENETFTPALSGIVLTPDGKPAVGAGILISTLRYGLHVELSHLDQKLLAKTDEAGKFTLPGFKMDQQEDRYALVLIHDDGCRYLMGDDFEKKHNRTTDAESEPIKLEAWGELEGTLSIGDRPGEGSQIYVSLSTDLESPRLVFYAKVTTGKDGKFSIRKLFPGDYSVSRYVVTNRIGGSTRSVGAISKYVVVESGKKAQIALGGTGRPVVGRVVGTPEAEKLLKTGGRSVRIRAPRPPYPEAPETPVEIGKIRLATQNDPEKGKELFAAWQQSEAGKKHRADTEDFQREWNAVQKKIRDDRNAGYGGKINGDGSFRVEDVESGDWVLEIDAFDDEKRARIHYEHPFTVPEIPGGRSDEALDLGTLRVEIQSTVLPPP